MSTVPRISVNESTSAGTTFSDGLAKLEQQIAKLRKTAGKQPTDADLAELRRLGQDVAKLRGAADVASLREGASTIERTLDRLFWGGGANWSMEEVARLEQQLATIQRAAAAHDSDDGDDEPVGRDVLMARMKQAGQQRQETDADDDNDDEPAGRDALMARMKGGAR